MLDGSALSPQSGQAGPWNQEDLEGVVDSYFLQAYAIKVLFMVCLVYGTGDQTQNFLHTKKAL